MATHPSTHRCSATGRGSTSATSIHPASTRASWPRATSVGIDYSRRCQTALPRIPGRWCRLRAAAQVWAVGRSDLYRAWPRWQSDPVCGSRRI